MSLRTLFYAYVLGGLTFIPLLVCTAIAIAVYTAVPAPPRDPSKKPLGEHEPEQDLPSDVNDVPRPRKAWLTVRRSFEDASSDASYVAFVKSYLDARSKDPKRARPKDTWYVVLKGKVLYLYEDEAMTECDAAIELGGHEIVVYPEGLLDGELFTRRNAICLKPRPTETDGDQKADGDAQEEDVVAPWFIFVRSCVDMEDWYLALLHASDHPSGTPTLNPLKPVFLPSEMNALVATLDEQPDVIPLRWFNALLGRIFYTFYRTQLLESYIIGRLMKKLSKVKRPAFLVDIAVTRFSVGNKAPTFSKPMLKELTKEGDASLEVGLLYKGEIRATVEATAVINLGAHFKSYTVKLVLAVVLRELEGNLLVKVKRPPSSRIWYAFTKPPRMVINVEPIVSDRQITWSMILNTIESKIEEIIIDSVVLPNMDDISFFDSLEYQHRGGVWADAVRLDKPPAPEAMSKPQSSEGMAPSISESESTPAPEIVPIIRSTTTSSTRAKRRSSGVDIGLDERAEEEARGRKERSTEPETLAPEHVIPDNDQDALSPRSPSILSRSSRAVSVSSSTGGDESFNYLSDTSPTSKSPRFPTTTSSFLSTLKSKAGDKQALSNTAKEAMRKWGVNWGMKKESSPSPDDHLDVGLTDSRPSHHSYADMRTAVIERRERDRLDKGTPPMAIPNGRSPSASGGRMTVQSSGSSSPSLPRSLGDVSTDPFKDRDLTEVAEDTPGPSLIHTQPSQARTMTIPGIHASHRGEVMSMGNVAPTLENKPKGPSVGQSMYRLWKSPILTGQPSQEGPDGNHDVAPLSLTPEVPSRGVPPPLPPRTISSVAVRHATEGDEAQTASQALKTIASRDETRREGEIAVDGESTEGRTARPDSSKPPLPPRRMPV